SSAARFVNAISKAMAAVKFAPLWNEDRAKATAAYEQDQGIRRPPRARAPSQLSTACGQATSEPFPDEGPPLQPRPRVQIREPAAIGSPGQGVNNEHLARLSGRTIFAT